MIRLLVLDMPGTYAEAHLEKHAEKLAYLLRRRPPTIRRAMKAERAFQLEKDHTMEALRRLRPSLEFIGSLFEQAARYPPPRSSE